MNNNKKKIDIIQLFSGIGVVIDEEIHSDDKNPNGIQKIVQSIESKNVPVLKYESLPGDAAVLNFHSISFVILDWNLSGMKPIPQATIDDNIEFIKRLKEVAYVPIFVFSDEDSNDIEYALSEHNITSQNSPIFVKKKDDLDSAEKLFHEIELWTKQTPSVYVLKEWERATQKAKTKMMWDLSSVHPSWPKILMKTFKKDGEDKHVELMNSLQNNLSYRIDHTLFDDNVICQINDEISKDDLRKIIECERFVTNEILPDHPYAGDIYLIEDKYLLNIRPDCDIIRDPDKKRLYLLEGEIIDEEKINSQDKDSILFNSGEFIEKNNCCYVAFVFGKILKFSLIEMEMKQWKDIKVNRIGRLLPPFITKIQQKYSAYIQRQGLPRIPDEALNLNK